MAFIALNQLRECLMPIAFICRGILSNCHSNYIREPKHQKSINDTYVSEVRDVWK